MLNKVAAIAVFRSIKDAASVFETAESTGNSERTVRRYRKVLSGFENGRTDLEIRIAVDNWVEPSIVSMRRWAVEAGIIDADALDPESIKRSAQMAHLEALAEFAATISDSLDVPVLTVTAVSGFGEVYWSGPFKGLLRAQPSLRVIEAGDGPQNLIALCEHMPRNDPKTKIQVILSSLKTYAHAANRLGEFIRRLLIDRGLFDDPKSVPHGLILPALYFGVEAASSGKSSDVVPVVEPKLDGSFVIRIGGWASVIKNSQTGEAMVRIFGELIHEISQLPEMENFIEMRTNYEDLVEQLRRLLTPKDKIRITVSKTSCSVCA